MKCKWCNGTYKECGCGEGHCAHCNHGVITDPPFGPITQEYCKELDTLSREDFDNLGLFNPYDINECIDMVSPYLVGKQVLSEEELHQFKDYWDDFYRDENAGQVLNRVAWLVKQKLS